VRPGQVRARGVSRRFRIFHERNATLKEALMRGRRGRYTELWALRDVDIDVAPGEALGVVGENGSGKSTLLKLLAGIIPPHEGSVEVGGRVASMLELGAGFHPDFTGRENVYMNAAIQGLSRRDVDARMDAIIAFSELEAFIDNPVRTYSSGMYTRLGFAVASHVDSDVLLLDEVLAVGDEAFQRKCLGRVFEYRRGGGTVVFVSHDAEAVERVCDRAVLLDHGELVAEGRPGDVLATYRQTLVREKTPGAGQPSAQEPSDEWGTRRVAITAVRTVGPDGESDRFASGGPLGIEIDFLARERVATPIFGVEIRAVDGTLCYGTNTRRDTYPVDSLEGTGTAAFAIDRLPLHEGRFLLTVAVTSADESEVYHWIDRRTELSVFARTGGVGLVRFEGRWSVSEEPSGARTRITVDG
jgi:ABC-type polysaccharide/polyol phosphate transport system ATPase subunit